MPKINTVKNARKAIPELGIAVGDTYYWWKRRYSNSPAGVLVKSKTYPKRQQLTSSGYLISIYDLEDETNRMDNESILNGGIDSLIESITSIKEELEEKLENMPEGLRENSSSGQMLQERIDAADEAISELEDAQNEAESWYGEHGESGYDLDSLQPNEDLEDDEKNDAENALSEAQEIIDRVQRVNFGG